MRYVRAGVPVLLTVALGCGGPETTAPGGASGKLGAVVEIDGLRSQAPDEWVTERPTPQQVIPRLAQFRLPGAGGADASLVVFEGIRGSAKANVERWKGQFSPLDGEPVLKNDLKVGHIEGVLLDVQGTFNERDMMNPQLAPQPKTEYRMIAIHLEGKKGPYHIKLTGPAKTVERHKQAFEDWLKGFK